MAGESCWEPAWCSAAGRWYYHDRKNGISSWDRPEGCTLTLPRQPPQDAKEAAVASDSAPRKVLSPASTSSTGSRWRTLCRCRRRGGDIWPKSLAGAQFRFFGHGRHTVPRRPPDEEAHPLPDGWESAWDPTHQRVYYFNRKHNLQTWTHPARDEGPASADVPGVEGCLPAHASSSTAVASANSPSSSRGEAPVASKDGQSTSMPASGTPSAEPRSSSPEAQLRKGITVDTDPCSSDAGGRFDQVCRDGQRLKLLWQQDSKQQPSAPGDTGRCTDAAEADPLKVDSLDLQAIEVAMTPEAGPSTEEGHSAHSSSGSDKITQQPGKLFSSEAYGRRWKRSKRRSGSLTSVSSSTPETKKSVTEEVRSTPVRNKDGLLISPGISVSADKTTFSNVLRDPMPQEDDADDIDKPMRTQSDLLHLKDYSEAPAGNGEATDALEVNSDGVLATVSQCEPEQSGVLGAGAPSRGRCMSPSSPKGSRGSRSRTPRSPPHGLRSRVDALVAYIGNKAGCSETDAVELFTRMATKFGHGALLESEEPTPSFGSRGLQAGSSTSPRGGGADKGEGEAGKGEREAGGDAATETSGSSEPAAVVSGGRPPRPRASSPNASSSQVSGDAASADAAIETSSRVTAALESPRTPGSKGTPPRKGAGKGPGAPPPAPTPKNKRGGKGAGSPRKPEVTPSMPMKKLFWSPINIPAGGSGSIWDKIHSGEVRFDTAELEALFAEAPHLDSTPRALRDRIESKEAPGFAGDNSGEVFVPLKKRRLLEEKRRRQLWFMLALMPEINRLLEAIQYLDDASLKPESVELLLSNLPVSQEEAMMRTASETVLEENEVWDVPEEFMIRLIALPAYATRIRVWEFLNSFNEKYETLLSAKRHVTLACDFLQDSPRVEKLLACTLYVGNYLNGGTARGRADGFDIEVLPNLGRLKASQKEPGQPGTLIDYIVQQVEKEHPNMLQDMYKAGMEFESVHTARKFKLAELRQEGQQLASLAEQYHTDMMSECNDWSALQERREQLAGCIDTLKKLAAGFSQLANRYTNLCKWFHLDTDKLKSSDEFFGIWDVFLTEVHKALQTLERKRILAEKKRRRSSDATSGSRVRTASPRLAPCGEGAREIPRTPRMSAATATSSMMMPREEVDSELQSPRVGRPLTMLRSSSSRSLRGTRRSSEPSQSGEEADRACSVSAVHRTSGENLDSVEAATEVFRDAPGIGLLAVATSPANSPSKANRVPDLEADKMAAEGGGSSGCAGNGGVAPVAASGSNAGPGVLEVEANAPMVLLSFNTPATASAGDDSKIVNVSGATSSVHIPSTAGCRSSSSAYAVAKESIPDPSFADVVVAASRGGSDYAASNGSLGGSHCTISPVGEASVVSTRFTAGLGSTASRESAAPNCAAFGLAGSVDPDGTSDSRMGFGTGSLLWPSSTGGGFLAHTTPAADHSGHAGGLANGVSTPNFRLHGEAQGGFDGTGKAGATVANSLGVSNMFAMPERGATEAVSELLPSAPFGTLAFAGSFHMGSAHDANSDSVPSSHSSPLREEDEWRAAVALKGSAASGPCIGATGPATSWMSRTADVPNLPEALASSGVSSVAASAVRPSGSAVGLTAGSTAQTEQLDASRRLYPNTGGVASLGCVGAASLGLYGSGAGAPLSSPAQFPGAGSALYPSTSAGVRLYGSPPPWETSFQVPRFPGACFPETRPNFGGTAAGLEGPSPLQALNNSCFPMPRPLGSTGSLTMSTPALYPRPQVAGS